jgi:glycosyltransferase involved in cell wall biosynthesis
VLSQLYYTVVEWLFVPRAAGTVTVSAPIADHLERRYGIASVALVPNYPEPPAALEPVDLRTLPGGERIPDDAPVVLFLGGLMAGRGLEELVDATARVPDAHLVLLGDGVLADSLRRRALDHGIESRVHLLPPVPPDRVVAVAASADVGASTTLPSSLNNRYSLPNKLFQYMAAGIPVVASDFPQVRAIVKDATCGVVVDTTRPSEVAEAIRSLLADPDRARRMGADGRRAVERRYNWTTSATALLELYRRVIHG